MMKRVHTSLEYKMRHTTWTIYGTSSLDEKYFQNYLPLSASALPVNEVKSENIHKIPPYFDISNLNKGSVPHGGLKLDKV